ncbi:MAG: THUMP domain-containing protein [Desulfurococcales archaeon]|nr:THUMP domain-containing protein [Desulfurococcales archaeon]
MTGETVVLLRGNPGTEDLIAEEALEELYAASIIETRKGHGRVVAEVPEAFIERVYSMRSIHSATLLLLMRDGITPRRESLDIVRDAILDSPVSDMVPLGGTFAVRVVRTGEHEFTSLDLARVAGDAVRAAVRSKRGFDPEVRLEAPSVVLELDVIEDKLYFGVSLTGERSLHRRGIRVYDHPAALKPTLAYVMLRLASARDGEAVADPMCGGGTVAIEAAYLYPTSRIVCMDKNPRHVRGAMMNAEAARVRKRIEFITGDAREMDRILGEDSIDVVVTNPPYGLRLGDPRSVRSLYRSFIGALYRVLRPGGRAAVITTEAEYTSRRAREVGFEVTHVRRVRHGDLWVSIIILEKGA